MMGYLFYGFAEVFIARQDAFLKKKFKKITKTQLLTLKICVFLLFHLLLSAIQLFTYIVGEQWTFHDAIYYTFITGAFLGETDSRNSFFNFLVYPTNLVTKISSTIICLLTTAIFYLCIGMVADWIFTKHKDDLWEAYFERQLSKITLNKMDKDKDGNVSYNDFLEYMLIRCELIDQEDLDRIYDRFQELDTDNDNMLNEKDVLIQNKV
jgi:hypothetical protein